MTADQYKVLQAIAWQARHLLEEGALPTTGRRLAEAMEGAGLSSEDDVAGRLLAFVVEVADMKAVDRLRRDLERDEGFRRKPYRDTVGKLTIGYGRNLDDVGISKDEGAYMLAADIARATADLYAALPWTKALDAIRREVLVNMAFNMGVGRWGESGLLSFVRTLDHIRHGRYEAAAKNMLRSKWARQVGARADRLSERMRTGKHE